MLASQTLTFEKKMLFEKLKIDQLFRNFLFNNLATSYGFYCILKFCCKFLVSGGIGTFYPYTSKNTDCLRAPCQLHQYCQWPQQQKKKRKEEVYPLKAGASSRHITNLKQSILETFDIYVYPRIMCRIFYHCAIRQQMA